MPSPVLCACIFCIYFLALFEGQDRLFAQKDSAQNLRLRCKNEISGVLLARHDQLHLAEKTLAAYERKHMQNNALLILRQEELTELKKAREERDFDARLQKRYIELNDSIAELTKQQAELQSATDLSRKDRDSASRSYSPLLTHIKKIFIIKPQRGSVKKSDLTNLEEIYGSDLDYQRECAKFEYVCKLTPGEVKQLRLIMQDEPESMLACEKYINQ